MEGLHTLGEYHDQAFKTLLERFRGFHTGQQVTPVISQPTPVSREPCLPPTECYAGDSGTCQAFLSQCSLIFELQLSLITSNRSRIEYIITLMSERTLACVTAVWELQSAVCLSLEEFVAEVQKVFDSPLSEREAAPATARLSLCDRLRSEFSHVGG